MCIAILKPKDKILDKDLLKQCSIKNPDGCGFAYIDKKTSDIIINKFMLFEDFWKEYSKLQKNNTMLIHFRIATHGNVEIQNCHPFKLNDRMALIHNGIISGYGSKTENLSDTRDFISKVIGNISHKMWKNPSFRELVGKAISYSKFAILDTDENYYIINEDKGHWYNGVWFSNKSYEIVKYDTTTKDTTTKYVTRVGSTPSSTKSNFGYIMRCPSCGKEVIEDAWNKDVCSVCKSQLETIGWIWNGNRNYYKKSYKGYDTSTYDCYTDSYYNSPYHY